jgi:hypothetical protein
VKTMVVIENALMISSHCDLANSCVLSSRCNESHKAREEPQNTSETRSPRSQAERASKELCAREKHYEQPQVIRMDLTEIVQNSSILDAI